MIKILFIPDINGRIGRLAVAKVLPKLRRQYSPDLVIANADNLAHGNGATKTTVKELMSAGVDWFTNGDHAFDRDKQADEVFGGELPVLRPANFPPSCPGKGNILFNISKNSTEKVLLVNLVGRVFMKQDFDCPFRQMDKILANLEKQNISAIIVDIHAEATSEKIALKHYLDGKVSAIIGTHTHVMTADQQISGKGTAYISDAGMAGAADGVLGVDKENIIKTFLTQMKLAHKIPEKGSAIVNALYLEINSTTARAKKIKPITEYVEIR